LGAERYLVRGARSTARRHETADHVHYLTYGVVSPEQEAGANPETQVLTVRLPKAATDIGLHGPGFFGKRGKGKVYGVRIAFTEQTGKGERAERHRTIELPHPVVNVQLLDRKPDEAYKSVA